MFYQGDHDDDDEPDQDAVFNQRPSHIPEQIDDEDIILPTNTSIETSTTSINKVSASFASCPEP